MAHVTIPAVSQWRSYIAGPGQTAFPVPFPFFDPADLRVHVNGAEVVSGFAVSGTAVDDGFTGGTVTFTAGRAAGETVTIFRQIAIQRGTDFPYPSRTLDIRAVNHDLDRLTAFAQDLDGRAARSLRVPPYEAALDELPSRVSRRNTALGFDGAGAVALHSLAALPTASHVIPLGADTPLLLTELLSYVVNVRSFGAKGDGVTDDTAAILAAVAYAASKGAGRVRFPAGEYVLSQTVVIAASGIVIEGDGLDTYHDFTPAGAHHVNTRRTTTIRWAGAHGGVMFDFRASGAAGLGGCGLRDLVLVSGTFPFTSAAGVGVRVGAVRGSTFHFVGIEFGFAALHMMAQDRDDATNETSPKYNTVSYLGSRNFSTTGAALRMDGVDDRGNAYNNTFGVIDALHFNGNAIELYSCDNNTFEQVRVQRADGGTGTGVLFAAGATIDTMARANLFYLLSPGAGGVYAEGTENGKAFPSYENKIENYNPDENNAPLVPSIGTGATLLYSTTKRYGGINCHVRLPADQVAPPGLTKLNFATSIYDPATWFDTATQRWRPRFPGTYLVTCAALVTMPSSGAAQLTLQQGGAFAAASSATAAFDAGYGATVQVVAMFEMNGTTDWLEARLTHNAAAAATVEGGAALEGTFFQATRIA